MNSDSRSKRPVAKILNTIPEMPEQHRPHRPRHERQPEARIGEHQLRRGRFGGKEQRPEHQRRGGGVDIEIVEFDRGADQAREQDTPMRCAAACRHRSEEHTSELQSLMRISYAVFCLKQKTSTPHESQSATHKNNRENINTDNYTQPTTKAN